MLKMGTMIFGFAADGFHATSRSLPPESVTASPRYAAQRTLLSLLPRERVLFEGVLLSFQAEVGGTCNVFSTFSMQNTARFRSRLTC